MRSVRTKRERSAGALPPDASLQGKEYAYAACYGERNAKKIRGSEWLQYIKKDFFKYRYLYLMILPVLLYYLLFHYSPMYGAQIAFKRFSPGLGIWGSPG
jgi:hypothetical protein